MRESQIGVSAPELAAMVERVRADERHQIVEALRKQAAYDEPTYYPHEHAADFIERSFPTNQERSPDA